MTRIPPFFTALTLLAATFTVVACGGLEVASSDATEPVDREYHLLALMTGYYGIGGEIDGKKNPVLTARKGELVRFVITNGELMPHDIALKEHKLRSPEILRKGEQTNLTFTALHSDTYYCTIPGHVQTGMIGQFKLIDEPEPTAMAAY